MIISEFTYQGRWVTIRALRDGGPCTVQIDGAVPEKLLVKDGGDIGCKTFDSLREARDAAIRLIDWETDVYRLDPRLTR
jgi:hypothetical protein